MFSVRYGLDFFLLFVERDLRSIYVHLTSIFNHRSLGNVELLMSGVDCDFLQAYKQRMYGKRYVWIIIGWYEDKWWEKGLDEEHITCNAREMGEAVEGYLATDHMKLNEDEITSKEKTVSGWVRN